MRYKDDGVVMHVKLAAEHIVEIGFQNFVFVKLIQVT